MEREMGKPIFLQSGSDKQCISEAESQETVLDNLKTHQETGTLEFPLVTMQFFSSGLIMVGDTVREAVVLTIGRDLWVYRKKYRQNILGKCISVLKADG